MSGSNDTSSSRRTRKTRRYELNKKRNFFSNNVSTYFQPTTARDLFGSDSEEEVVPENKKGKKQTPIFSFFTRRLANGFSRQMIKTKKGSHYVEVKIYKTSEIENVQPVNRWRHSIITIKNQIDEGSDTRRVLQEMVGVTKKEFKKYPAMLLNQYY